MVASGNAKNYLILTFLPNTPKCSPCVRYDRRLKKYEIHFLVLSDLELCW